MRRYSKILIASLVVLVSAWMILLRAQVAGPTVNTWTQVGNLGTARAAACSVLLPDGRVLVAGGSTAAGAVNTVDILGSSGAFTPGPPMLQARANAACALLQDGRVFVSGGTDGTKALATAEIFTPSTNVWSSAGTMNVARYGHTATVTQMGAVLLVGGQTAHGVTDQVEAFRPANGRYLALGAMSSPRNDYSVAVIDKHRTLIAGGVNGGATLNTIDIFDSSTNALTAAGAMQVARHGFAAVTLLDGTVMFTGGYGADGTALASTEIYNPKTQTSAAGPQLSAARASHQGMTLPGNGAVLLFGGTDGQNALSATDVYQPWTGKFAPQAAMNTARTGMATSLMRPGSMIVAGGKNSSGYVAGAEAYTFAIAGTSKPDYHPGEVATMTGAGWKPGESVAFTVTAFPVDQHNIEFTGTAAADSTGRVTLTGFNIDKSHLGVTFLLDLAGSQSHAQTTFSDADPTTITSTIVSPGSPHTYGQTVEFQGNVIDNAPTPNNGTPQGSVSIYDNNISVISPANLINTGTPPTPYPQLGNSASLSGGAYDIQVVPHDPQGILDPGYHIFQIEYAGDLPNWAAAATIEVNYQVFEVVTASAFTATTFDQTVAYGQQATLKAVVTTQIDSIGQTYSEPPLGGFIFNDSATSPVTPDNCVGVPTYGPNAGLGLGAYQTLFTCQTSVDLGVGIHIYTGTYNGLTNVWETSQTNDTRQVTVNSIFTTTTVTALPTSPQVYPQSVTLTATVVPSFGSGTVTGTVIFYDGNNPLCSGPVPLSGSPGSASCGPLVLTGGAHNITATFANGSPNYANSTSGTLVYQINAAPTSSSLQLSVPSPEIFGTSETFTAIVTCTGCAPPTGQVNFLDLNNSSLPINPAPITLVNSPPNSATASYTTTALPGGAHSIEVSYISNNTSQYANSFSAATPYSVNGIAPTFSINTVPSNPTAYQPITLTLTANPSGGHTPAGSVRLDVDSLPQGGFVALNNGSATFNLTGLSQGTHSLGIDYNAGIGEVDFVTTAGASVTPSSLTVGLSATTVAVTASQTSPMLFGTPVTFTATVKPANSAITTTPTGTVTFSDSILGVLATNPLVGNTATYSPANTAFVPGLHSVTAQYNGDTSFSGGSVSPAFNLTVNQATTSTSVTANFTSINLGQPVQYTASVSGTPGTAGNPTGSITITDNGTPLTACSSLTTLSSANPATVSCTVNYNGSGGLGGGSHSIIAYYSATTSPSQLFANSNSSPITVTVHQATFTFGTLATVPPTTAVYNDGGNPVTLTIPFTLGNTPPPYPNQNFQIFDTGSLISSTCPVPVSSPASCAIPLATYQTVGPHSFYVTYPTGDPNFPTATSASVAFTVTKYIPTVAASGFAGSAFGSPVAVGGTVNASAGGSAAVPSGTLTFTFGATTLGTCTLSTITASCTLNTTNTALVAGPPPDTINIAYSGDANYASASGSGPLNVATNTVSTTVTTSPGAPSFTAILNTQVVIKAVVAPVSGSAVPTGTITFYDTFNGSTNSIGSSSLNNGVALLSTSALAAGVHTLSASYSGDSNFSPLAYNSAGVATATLTVSTGNTTVTITPSTSSIALGLNSTVTYTYSVTAGSTPPQGTVQLLDGGSAISNVTNGGTCTNIQTIMPPSTGNTSTGSCTVTYDGQDAQHGLGLGTRVLTFSYVTGNSSLWSSGTSPSAQVTVTSAAPTIGTPVATPVSPIVYYQQTTITVTVTGTSGGPTPTGFVNFYDTGTLLNASPIAFGAGTTTATLPSPTTPVPGYSVGSHTIVAKYLGDSNYAPVTSLGLALQVNKNSTTTTVTSGSAGETYGVSQTLTATVTPSPLPGNAPTGTPTGTVTFWANGTINLGQGTLTCSPGCQATTTLSTQLAPSGTPYSVTATYNADANFSGSTSAVPASVTVGKNTVTGTQTTLTPSPLTSANLGSAVTLTAVVGPTAPGTGTPTGTVTFYDQPPSPAPLASLGPATLNASGVATLTTSSLVSGVHAIYASYGGDNYFQALAQFPAPALTYTIVQGNTTVVTTPSVTAMVLGPNSTVTYTYSVTGGATPPQGTVQLLDGGLAIPVATNGGTCNNIPITLAPPSSGNTDTGSCTVIYNGQDAQHNLGTHVLTFSYVSSSTSQWTSANSPSVQVTVTSATPTIGTPVSTPVSPIVYYQQTAISVTVTGTSGGPAPTGFVNFYDTGTLLNASPIAFGAGTTTATLPSPTTPVPGYSVGSHTIVAKYLGDSNYAPVTSLGLALQVNKNSTTTTVTSGSAGETYGVSQTLTATVTPSPLPGNAPTGNPTGTVTFWANTTINLGQGTLTCSTGCQATTTLTTQLAPSGTPYSITATYNADGNFSGSTSAVPSSVTVGKNTVTGTQTTLTPSPLTSANLGSAVTLTAVVGPTAPGTGTPTGTVTFYDQPPSPAPLASLGPATLNASGVATLTTSSLVSGVHTIYASYGGDNYFQAVAQFPIPALTYTIVQGNTTVTTTPSAASIVLGPNSTVTYTYSVTGGATPPQGTVQLLDGGLPIPVATNGGTCNNIPITLAPPSSGNTDTGSCTVTYNGQDAQHNLGTHVLTFSYVSSSTSQWTSANSPSVQVTVTSATPTIGTPVATPPSPVVYYQQTAISVTVTGTSGGPAPTGSVNFYDTGTLLNASPIAFGTGTTTATLPSPTTPIPGYSVGTHTITAKYLGDSNYVAVTSLGLVLQVNKNSTTTTVTSGSASETYGASQTLTATVTPSPLPGNAPTGNPTGTVTFWANTTINLGQGTLSCAAVCQATTTLNTQLAPGGTAYSITAAYNGDGNFSTSTSAPTAVTVVQNTVTGTQTTLTPSPLTKANFGSAVQLTAVVGPTAPGAGTPTGTVTFWDQPPAPAALASLGTATLNASGVATLTTSSLVPGVHTIYAAYGGDSNFQALAQFPVPALTYTIVQGNTTVTLTPSSNPTTLNQTITYSFTVQGGPSSPTGTVTLTDGITTPPSAIPSCTNVTLNAPGTGNTSSGSCTVSYNAINSSDSVHWTGSHPITATYTPTTGVTTWTSATSSVVAEVVGKLQPTLSAIVVTPSVATTCPQNYCFPYGTTFTFSVTMNPVAPTPAYTGKVIFTDNGVPIGQPASIDPVLGTATIQGIILGGGTNTIVATFPGDLNYLSDPSTVVIVITKLPLLQNVTETLSAASLTVTYGGPLPASGTFTANFAAPISCSLCAIPTGTVTVLAGPASLPLGTFNIQANGVTPISVLNLPAALSATTPPANAYTFLYVNYSGDANYAPPSPQLQANLIVNQATPYISLASSPNPSSFGQNVTFVSNVTNGVYGVGKPTGSVSFTDNTPTPPVVLTSNALLVSGTANFQDASLSPGTHAVTATYSGDTNFLSVSVPTASAVQQIVNPGNVTLTVTPSTYSTSLNTSVVYTIVASSAAGAPQGTVSLFDSINTSAPGPGITNCTGLTLVTIPPSSPPVNPPSSSVTCTVPYNNTPTPTGIFGTGTHIVSAEYAPTPGTTTWTAAGSPAVTVTVGKSPVSISQPTVSPAPTIASPLTYTYGTPLTYTVVLTPANPNPAYQANTVQFYDNGTPLGGPQNVVSSALPTPSSTASYGPTVPLGGSHTITAQFIGDANYTQSAVSANLVFTVIKPTPTVTVLTPPASAPYVSQISTGQVSVAVPAGNSGITPTGSVSLIAALGANTTTLATSALDASGHFTFVNVQLPASLVATTYNLYVQYGGDGNWAAAPSTPTQFIVGPTPAPVTVTSANIPPATNTNPIYGQTLVFTATFNGPGNPVAGNITFQNNGANIPGCVSVVVANNVATCTVNNLPVTTLNPLTFDNVTVTNLTNDPNHSLGTVTGTGNFSVGSDPTNTTLTSSPNPSQPGQAFTLLAAVTVPAPGVSAPLTGTVTFVLNVTPPVNLCSAVPLSGASSPATATCAVAAGTAPFTLPSVSGYQITATYTPGATDKSAGSFGTVNQVVSQPAPIFQKLISTTPAPPVNPSVYGETVTFTVTFSLPLGSTTAPNGQIQFYDGSSSLGSLQPQQLTALGSGLYTSSITVPAANNPNPKGPCGYPNVLCGGQHVISAIYVPGIGDSYASANSATQQPTPVTLIQQVNQATVTITAPPPTYVTQGITNAPVYAEQVTYTATITPSGNNGGVPTGQVMFMLAGSQFGPLVTLVTNNGITTASLTYSSTYGATGTPNLPVGSDIITVSYLGDQNFAATPAATPTAFPAITVSPAPTMTVLTPPTSPSPFGTELTLTAKVCATQVNPSASNACIGTPFPGFKGTMTFYDGSTVLNPGGIPVPVDPNTGIGTITITLTSPPLAAPAVGTHNISATYNGGGVIDPNFASSSSVASQLNLSVGPSSTTSNVASSNDPSVIGQPVTLTARILATGSFAAAPTGTVTFYDGGVQIGSATLGQVGGVSTASLTVPSANGPANPFSLGQHVISFVYSGDVNYATSSTPVSPPCTTGVTTSCALVQIVNQATTTTSISSSQNSSTTGQQVTLTAVIQVVAPGAAVLSGPSAGPTGTVTFTNNVGANANVLGTGTVTRTGVNGSSVYLATLTLANIPTGQTAITAAYSGDQNYTASSSQALNQSVNTISSNATISSNLNPSFLGQPVTFTITISPTPPGQGIPTGAVTLSDGSNVLANIQLVGGQATYTASLAVGGHGIIVNYTGDANFQGVVSGTLNQIVNKIQTTLNLSSSVPAGAVASQVITFTAQIQPTPLPGVPYATGQVGFFMDGATQIGAASLQSGVAALSTTLPAGNHQIQALYVGDLNWTNAQSIYLQQVVGTASTTTQVVSSIDPSVFGQPVTITVTVAVPYPGTVPASGTVQLYDSGNAIGNPLPANNGTFSTTLTSLAPGNHSIVAEFQANGSFSQSSSAALSQIVNKAPTVTTLAAFPNSSTSNQSVTLTAVLTVPSPGAGTPTGTVQFVNTTTSAILGSAPLDLIGGIWTATLNTSSLSLGNQTQLLTATYSGDGNFATSTSIPQPQSVFGTQISVVNAAGYTGTNFAPDSFAAVFGQNLAYTTATALTTPLPSSLSGTTVQVTDSAGTARLAPLYYVSLSQIDFVIPSNTAYGLATVTVTNASGETASTIILVTVTAPGLYSMNANGQGVGAGFVVTVHADGSQSAQVPLFQFDPNQKIYVPVPIVWNNSTDLQYLVLYGTGYDRGTTNNTTATINGITVPVIYVGQQPQFTAEDQVNIGPIPQSLKGAGTVNGVLTVNGQQSNAVTVQFQ